uniref:Uncharacterized protein n=1 Tax=Oncorhynchus kisutch TaxID=8019 RepID=A0A8C7MFD7_ONCKI
FPVKIRRKKNNDSSVLSKVSAVAQGYFLDDYLRQFVFKEFRRAPLINRSAVDHCVKPFLWLTECCPRRQVSVAWSKVCLCCFAKSYAVELRSWNQLMNLR